MKVRIEFDNPARVTPRGWTVLGMALGACLATLVLAVGGWA